MHNSEQLRREFGSGLQRVQPKCQGNALLPWPAMVVLFLYLTGMFTFHANASGKPIDRDIAKVCASPKEKLICEAQTINKEHRIIYKEGKRAWIDLVNLRNSTAKRLHKINGAREIFNKIQRGLDEAILQECRFHENLVFISNRANPSFLVNAKLNKARDECLLKRYNERISHFADLQELLPPIENLEESVFK